MTDGVVAPLCILQTAEKKKGIEDKLRFPQLEMNLCEPDQLLFPDEAVETLPQSSTGGARINRKKSFSLLL